MSVLFKRKKFLVIGAHGVVKTELARGARGRVVFGSRPDADASGIDTARDIVVVGQAALDRDLVGLLLRSPAERRVFLLDEAARLTGEPEQHWRRLGEAAALRCRRIDLPLLVARRHLQHFPLHSSLDLPRGERAHLLFDGLNDFGQALLLQALYVGHYGGAPPRITVIDSVEREQRFRADFPQLDRLWAIDFFPLRDDVAEGDPPVSAVYVCRDDDQEARSVAQEYAAAGLLQRHPPIHLPLRDPAVRDSGDWNGRVYPYHYLSLLLEPEILFGSGGDELAAVIHAYYRDSVLAQGSDPDESPSSLPWEQLDETFRESSRHQADHAGMKLASIGCHAVPMEGTELLAMSVPEVERLARIEHDRWIADRAIAGWQYGPERDNERRMHPEMKPYDQLTAAMKDLDRYAVRLLPVLMARQGQGIIRDLTIGVIVGPEAAANAGVRTGARTILDRLVERHPDRMPVILSSLRSPLERMLARLAMECHGAALFVLLDDDPAIVIAGLPAAAARDYRELLRRAERRLPLAAGEDLGERVRTRAEVLIHTDNLTVPADKPVHLDLRGGVEWGFEY